MNNSSTSSPTNGSSVEHVCTGDSTEVIPEGIASARFQVLVWAAYTLTLGVSVTGNCSVLAVVATQRRMRTATNLYLANLALGDLLMTLLCVPFSSVSMFVLQYWPFGGALCLAVNYCQAVSVLVSAYTLVALSADRYRAIVRPLRSRRRAHRPRALLLLGLVWVAALTTALPIALHSTLVQPSEWHARCDQSVCTEVWLDPGAALAYSLALTLAQFGLPLITLLFTYTCIGWRVWRRQPPPGGAVISTSARHPYRRARRRTLRMTVTVVVGFIICWLPFNVLLLAPPLEDPTWAPLPYLWFAFHWLAMTHCCLNPLIYCYLNANFRAGFRALLVPPRHTSCCRVRATTCGANTNTSSSTTALGATEVEDEV